jgi:hypothetical protein
MPFPGVNFYTPRKKVVMDDGKYIASILVAFDFLSTYVVVIRKRYRASHGLLAVL